MRACKRAARVPIDPRGLHLLPLGGVVAALPGRVYRGPSRCLLASYATGYDTLMTGGRERGRARSADADKARLPSGRWTR